MQGELNFFVDSFLEILNNGQNILKNDLHSKIILREEGELNRTRQTIRRKLNILSELNLLEKTSKNLLKFVLNTDYLEED